MRATAFITLASLAVTVLATGHDGKRNLDNGEDYTPDKCADDDGGWVPTTSPIHPLTPTPTSGEDDNNGGGYEPSQTGYHPHPGSPSSGTVPIGTGGVVPPPSETPAVSTTPTPIPIGSAGRVAAGGLLAGVMAVLALAF